MRRSSPRGTTNRARSPVPASPPATRGVPPFDADGNKTVEPAQARGAPPAPASAVIRREAPRLEPVLEREAASARLLAAVDRFLSGDEQAFDEAAPLAGRMAYHLALRAVHDSDSAEEIAQEALARFYRSAREIGDAKAFKSWFYRVVLNLVNDHYRRLTRRDQMTSSLEELQRMELRSRTDPLSELERAELRENLNNALAALDEKQREVFLLKEVEQHSHAEIAKMLGIPEGTVWSRLSYARKKLRKILGGQEHR